MAIEIRDVEKTYGATRALGGVTLSIPAGGITGLLGPNGAGKTTLVEILEGLRMPTRGAVSVLGLDPSREARALRSRLGVQLQSTGMPQDLTAFEVVRLYGSFYRAAQPPAGVLARVGLAPQAGVRVRNLSGGQRQRLALAIALVHEPELLILDEPTTGLDPAARRAVLDVVRAFRDEGRSVILTTHYLEEAEQLCDRVVILRAGEVVADGSPFELLGRAGGASTLWIACDGPLDPAPLEAAGAVAHGREGEHHRFVTRDPAAVVVALGDLLRARRVTLTDLRMKRPTLEDVYLELVGESGDDTFRAGGRP
jgi:ABC-2 type transport system ATP-binding protein